MDDDTESVDYLTLLPDDFPLDGFFAVGDYLTQCDVCVPGYIPPPIGLYRPEGFFFEQHVDNIRTILLPDRNVASRFAQMAMGAVISTDQQLRNAAALMAFAQCASIEIEPSVAFHELAHKAGNEAALQELGWFRAADNVNTRDWLSVALGHRNQLLGTYQTLAVPQVDLAKPLARWRRNYILALKMMELEYRPIRPVQRVLELLDWMRTDFIFGGPAALLASVYFAPNSPPKRRVFKDQASADREAALEGVKNAAWDLTHLSDFVRRVNEHGPTATTRYLFASFDKALRQFARLLFVYDADQSMQDMLPAALSPWWGASDATTIAAAVSESLEHVRSPAWEMKQGGDPNFIDALIARGEQLVREHR
ncbi:Uncharacterised protein [Achromobacter xylosoxidans]|uniref:hypothetical protein n=1 Tax=Alcaligenes xylosoxydans xylosoxydans TaxID=85698 RepID=UPI0006C056CA|nr:hypothetical protein [Achromobacter xylosoxidans]CUJ75449.1 Uncharacterised protein [Achromobacter xylosoxidans]